jgi:UDP-glucuronate 4-epimerase
MRILVTGGAGFIGAHVAAALARRGDEVVVLDTFTDFVYTSHFKRARVKTLFASLPITIIEGTISDSKRVAGIMRDFGIEKVVHFAAHANAGQSVHEAEAYHEENVTGTLRLLGVLEHFSLQQLVFASSSTVYDDKKVPFVEAGQELRPCSPYGATKLASEGYLSSWHALMGVPVTLLRFFSVYGPWGRPDMAPDIFARRILQRQSLHITPGRNRDYTYITDAVAGVEKALDTSFPFEIINLGFGAASSLEDLAMSLGEAAGYRAHITYQDEPEGEMAITYADITKARRLLGYRPQVSLQEGAYHLMSWCRKYASVTSG